MPYETYALYKQAESAFRALYLGRPLDIHSHADPSTKIVQHHWAAVEQLADTLRREKSFSREQVLKLMLQATLEGVMYFSADILQ
jgi:hypothetical protein